MFAFVCTIYMLGVCDKGERKAFSLCYILRCVYYMSSTRKTQKSSTRKRKLYYIALYTIVKILIVIILHSAVLYN